MEKERRHHRRLDIRLPLECCPTSLGPERAVRTVTRNISTGGLYFEVDLLEDVAAPEVHSLLNIELRVPPGDGYFPYDGKVTSVAEVVRCSPTTPHEQRSPQAPTRVGVGARFREPLTLVF